MIHTRFWLHSKASGEVKVVRVFSDAEGDVRRYKIFRDSEQLVVKDAVSHLRLCDLQEQL